MGEKLAQRYLQTKGYYIWQTNWRCKEGEIDIVAWRNGILSFIEVKTRIDSQISGFCPFEAVDKRKRIKLAKAAKAFIKKFRRQLRARRLRRFRFDTVGVYLTKGQKNQARIELKEECITNDEHKLRFHSRH